MKQPLATVRVVMRSVEEEPIHRPGFRDEYQVKNKEPSIMAHIKAANMIPNGRFDLSPASSCDSFNAGNLKKIQRYMEPSKQQEVKQRAQSLLSASE